MRSHVIELVVCFLVFGAWTQKVKTGGFPKFPTSSCGFRSIQWNPKRAGRIVGGEETPQGAAPWLVQLRRGLDHQCGGVVVSSRMVLTVAHCWTEGLVAAAGTRTRGSDGKDNFEQVVRVQHSVPHPNFRKDGPYSDDIAVVILESPGLRLGSSVAPVCLSSTSPPVGTWCEVSGWGAVDPKEPEKISSRARAAAVPLLSQETCRRNGIYGGRQQAILDTMVCAGHLGGGIDACGGDSGGPLVCERDGRMELTGLVSWGDGCAKPDRPGVYTRVPNYVSWIRKVARQYGIQYR